MPAPLVPIGLVCLIGTAYIVKTKRDQKMDVSDSVKAERAVIFDTAINQVKDPNKLMALSSAFAGEGLMAEAKLLQQRAELATAAPEVKAERNAIFKKGMASKNPVAIREVAQAFDDIGATGCAVALRGVAEGLESAAKEQGVNP